MIAALIVVIVLAYLAMGLVVARWCYRRVPGYGVDVDSVVGGFFWPLTFAFLLLVLLGKGVAMAISAGNKKKEKT